MEIEQHKSTKKIFTKEQKQFIGSVLLATSIVFLLIGLTLILAILIITGFKIQLIIQAIGQDFLTSIVIGLIAIGIIGFSTGITLKR